MRTRIVLIAAAIALSSPSLAQTTTPDPGAMSCADYAKASKNSLKGVLGSVSTGDAEADASMAEMDQQILKVCTKSPKITIREAMQKAIMEMD